MTVTSEFIHSESAATVIVPVFNRERLLTRCLDSIYAQRFRPINMVIVDNDSTDSSFEKARGWAAAHSSDDFRIILLSERIPGAAAARQCGFDYFISSGASPASPVFFFDSDDTMRPDLIARAMDAFLKDSKIDIVCWRARFHFLDGSERDSRPYPDRLTMTLNLVHCYLSTQRYSARAGIFAAVGGWKRETRVWDDWELATRILITSPSVEIINTPLCDVYSQEESITGDSFSPKAGEWEKVIELSADEISSSSLPEREKAHLLRVLAYRRAVLAAFYRREGNLKLASALLRQTLSDKSLSLIRRLAIRASYLHTAAGLRGAFSIYGHLL